MNVKYTAATGLISRSEFVKRLSVQTSGFEILSKSNFEVYNVPAAFDIEVTSFYEGAEKRAIMYIWQFGINNLVTTGRTWKEFWDFLDEIRNVMYLDEGRRLFVYVHNLPYEWQFIRKWNEWDKVFLLEERKPVYARVNGIEFRCSLKLAGGKSLKNIGEDLQRYPCKKMDEIFSYKELRSPATVLTEEEYIYCENDIRVLLHYIQEKIEDDGSILKIPLTNTGYVREYCRKECYKDYKYYRAMISELTISLEEYKVLRAAFQGGFTHANSHYVGHVVHDVHSQDIISSYPGQMVWNRFPMSRPYHETNVTNVEKLTKDFKTYCCIFTLEIWDLMPKLHQEHIISRSKCIIPDNWSEYQWMIDNGRVVMSDYIKVVCTEQDYRHYCTFYTWSRIRITNLYRFEKGYLPKRFVEAILKLYEDKTTLKDDNDKQVQYNISKNMINAGYGMMVTNPLQSEIDYIGDEYVPKCRDAEERIEIYNKNKNRFLYYAWGIYVTAYARSALFMAIKELGEDYVYSDTDSVKYLNYEKHQPFFDRYNAMVMKRIQRAAEFHKISVDRFMPKTLKKKEKKVIGAWGYEGMYLQFKTLGAKRYLVTKLNDEGQEELILTVAGTSKEKTAKYLLEKGKPFLRFDFGLTVPEEHSGRLVSTYIDDEISGTFVDRDGIVFEYYEKSCIHMEDTTYEFSVSKDFNKFLRTLQHEIDKNWE